MTLWQILGSIIIAPLQLFFEVVFMMAGKIVRHPGASIVVLSLVMNFLLLPLYKRADAMQEEERETEKRLSKVVSHIKKTFRGNERVMMLQAYYSENNYKPTYMLRSAVSLFLEIPFFIAAYRFLSGLKLLHGVSLGPIADLGRPDALLLIAGVSINLLPIIMTAINLVSCVIFTKGATLKSKIQLYGMAIFFLVFLYSSPSGLVFYWTLNNLFSLLKTIFYKLKNPGKVVAILFSLGGLAVLAYVLFFNNNPSLERRVAMLIIAALLQTPLLYIFIKARFLGNKEAAPANSNPKLFFAAGIFLALFIGVLIPSSVIKSSPQEFFDVASLFNPLIYLLNSLCLALGAFLLWSGVFYRLAKPRARVVFEKAFASFSVLSVINYMFFGKKLGVLSTALQYEQGLSFDFSAHIINAAITIIVIALIFVFAGKYKKYIVNILIVACIATGLMSGINAVAINSSIKQIDQSAVLESKDMPEITLSKTAKNVIVLMLDRAKGEYFPYIFNEKPELKEQFSGFTYYSNVISFGLCTNLATPALFGGYEYTPLEMNRRETEPLQKKHDEALRVMPAVFSKNNFDVTVCDPVFESYTWIPPLKLYKDLPSVKAYNTIGRFTDPIEKEKLISNNKRNFFCFGVLKSMPILAQIPLYDSGNYFHPEMTASQVITGEHTASGIFSSFMSNYSVLKNLPSMTKVADAEKSTFLLMSNNATHEPMMLKEPEYIPAKEVDNREFEKNNADRFVLNGKTLSMESSYEFVHYQAAMASFLQLGKWFDYLKENEVYDNTRIILVSDHGWRMGQVKELFIDSENDFTGFFPLLMVKDFGSTGFHSSHEFMTNADVPAIAMQGLIDNPKNPFTGNSIDSSKKTTQQLFLSFSNNWNPQYNNGNTFTEARWASVKDDIWNLNNWKYSDKPSVMPNID